jgi:ABC-type phosphate/phosphonate transport system permease subunit
MAVMRKRMVNKTHRGLRRTVAIAASIATFAAVVVSAFAMYAAWDHNPQGEFHETFRDGTTVIHWGDWLGIGLSWFLMVGVPIFLGAVGIGVLRRKLSKTPTRTTDLNG